MSKVVKKLKYKISDTELSDDIYFKVDNGEGLDYVDNKLKVKPATQSALGGVKPDGTSITIDLDGTIHSGAGSLEAGEGISIIDNKINTKVDGQTVFFNQQGQLSSTGGGGGGVGSLTRDLIVNQLNGVLFDKTDLGSNIYEIETHNDLLLLSKEGSPIQWSTDGITWNNGTSINGGYFLRSFDVAGTKYAYMSARNSAQYSVDGKTWTDYNISGVSNYWNMCSNGRELIQGTDKGVYFTEDGITWAATDLTTGGYGRYNIAYGNGRFVVGGADGIYYSDDGLHWNKGDYTGNQLNGVTYGTTGFVAYSGNNSVGYYYSADGQHWEKTNVEEGVSGDVVFGQGYFLGCLSGIGMFYSDDGKNWTQTSVAKNSFINGADVQTFKFIRGMWIGCGSKGIFYSTDGKNWYPSNITDTTYDVVFFNNSIFVTGDKTKYIYKYTPSSVIYGDNIANATKTDAGVVRPDGTTIDVSADGTLTALGESGETIINKINLDGSKQIFASKVSKATSFGLGVIKPDNVTTFVNTDGVLSAVGGTGGVTKISSADTNLIVTPEEGTGEVTIKNNAPAIHYSDGLGINIDSSNVVSVKIDNDTIVVDENGNLKTKNSSSLPNFEAHPLTVSNDDLDYQSTLNQKLPNETIGNYQLTAFVFKGVWYYTVFGRSVNQYATIGYGCSGELGHSYTVVPHQTAVSDGNIVLRSRMTGSESWIGEYSYDNVNWQPMPTPMVPTNYINGVFFGISTRSLERPRVAYVSTDGLNWRETSSTLFSPQIAYGNGKYLTTIHSSYIKSQTVSLYASSNGVDWEPKSFQMIQSDEKQYNPSFMLFWNGNFYYGQDVYPDEAYSENCVFKIYKSSNAETWERIQYTSSGCAFYSYELTENYLYVYYLKHASSQLYTYQIAKDGSIKWYEGYVMDFKGKLFTTRDGVRGLPAYSIDGTNWTVLTDMVLSKISPIKVHNDCLFLGPLCSFDGIRFSLIKNMQSGIWVNVTPDMQLLRTSTAISDLYIVDNNVSDLDRKNNYITTNLSTSFKDEEVNFVNLFLTIKNEKTTLANQGDEIIGIIQQGENQMSIIGCLTVQDDGTCVVGQKCNVSHDGIATLSEDGYIVLERLEDNLIKIIFK